MFETLHPLVIIYTVTATVMMLAYMAVYPDLPLYADLMNIVDICMYICRERVIDMTTLLI